MPIFSTYTPNTPDGTTIVTSAGKLALNKDDLSIEYGTYGGATSKVYSSLVPIGSILAWAKTITGVPALPSTFVECSGQTLSDAQSPINGQVIPNLNGNNNFLRGASTSGSTGGNATHTHSDGNHNHTLTYDFTAGGITKTEGYGGGSHSHAATNHEPPFYEVVWIMRVK
jgi:hypothetical protein